MALISGARRATAILVSAAVLTAASFSASAEQPIQNDPVSRNITPAEIQALRAEQRRNVFQQQQQNLREQDRLRVGAPQPRPNVPVMVPTLPRPGYGNSYIR